MTIKGWVSQWQDLQRVANENLSLLALSDGALCTCWWDTKPFVYHLACSSYGLDEFSQYHEVSQSIRELSVQMNRSVRENTKPNKSIQAAAQSAIISSKGGYSFHPLLLRRCSPSGIESIAVISSLDVERAFSVVSTVSHVVAMAWVKTVTNAWCTSTRMHEAARLPCIFGCKDSIGRLDHYIDCTVLWSIIHEAFEGNFTPCIVARLCYSAPSHIKFIHIACAFEVYHALKIGLRSVIDDAVCSSRLSEVIRVASKLVCETRQKYTHFLPETVSWRPGCRLIHI